MNQLVIEAPAVLDEHADLDAERAEELIAAQRTAERAEALAPKRCQCTRSLPDTPDDLGQRRCVWCGRTVGA